MRRWFRELPNIISNAPISLTSIPQQFLQFTLNPPIYHLPIVHPSTNSHQHQHNPTNQDQKLSYHTFLSLYILATVFAQRRLLISTHFLLLVCLDLGVVLHGGG